MKTIGRTLARLFVACAILAIPALQGCREDEQGRVLLYKKGTYLGQADQKLTGPQVDELRQRGLSQKY